MCKTIDTPNTVRRNARAKLAAVAAWLFGAVALLPAEPVLAHGLAPAARDNAVPAVAPPTSKHPWGRDYFPNVELTTHEGATVRLYDDLLKGKSVAINVMFTACNDECPMETARMVQVKQLLGDRVGKDIFFYSITLDPERDTPEALKAYAKKFNTGPGWLFLTGKPADLKLIVRKLGLSKGSKADSKDDHSASLMIGNEPTGQWMRNSALDNPDFLEVTIRNFLGWKDVTPAKSYAEARPLDLDRGQYLFQSLCIACHTVGQGDKIGPDLLGVTTRRERSWLTRYITAPDALRNAGDPIATALFAKYKNVPMPNLRLASDEVAAVLSYLEKQKSPPDKQAGKTSASARKTP